MTRRLGSKAAASYCGLGWSTFRGYVARGQAPKPDGYDDDFSQDYWLATSLDTWLASRPGHGGRPRKT